MNTTIGKRIAALRREKELKQDELAEKLGVSPQGRQQVGKRPDLPRYFPAPLSRQNAWRKRG